MLSADCRWAGAPPTPHNFYRDAEGHSFHHSKRLFFILNSQIKFVIRSPAVGHKRFVSRLPENELLDRSIQFCKGGTLCVRAISSQLSCCSCFPSAAPLCLPKQRLVR